MDTVKLLLAHGAPVEVVDRTHEGTPLEWALFGWGNKGAQPAYCEVVALLVQAGAKFYEEWFRDDAERRRAAEKLKSDARMQAALRGELPA